MTEPEDRVDLMAPPTPEDPRNSADLLARASDGDAMAWEELFRRYHRLVRSTVASFRLQEADAQDAVQNTWLRVREQISTIRDPERLGGWLATTASRECLALIRRRHLEVPEDVASKQIVTAEEEPDAAVIAGQASTADTAMGLNRRREVLIQHLYLFYEVDRATGIPLGPTRRRALRALRGTPEQQGFVSQAGADVVEDVKREPTEGNRTGSHLLDDLLDKADQALREKLEPKVTDIKTGSTQGTGDAQLDDLLQRADAALRAALHDQGTTDLSSEEDDRDGRIALLLADRSQEGTRSRAQLDAIAHKVDDTADALPGRSEEPWEPEPSELDEARRRSAHSGGMQAAGKPLVTASTTPPPSRDRPPLLLSRTAWSAVACVAVALAGTLVFLEQNWRPNAVTIQVLMLLGVLPLVCLGSLLWMDWIIQALLHRLREQAEERRRLSEELFLYERILSDENADQRPRQASDTRPLHRGSDPAA